MTALIKVKVQRKAIVKLKVLPKFPVDVVAGAGLVITRLGLSYTFSLDLTNATIPAPTITGGTANRLIVTNGAGIWGMGTVPAGLALLNSALTFDIPSLAIKASPHATNDYVIVYDAAGATTKRSPAGSFGAGAGVSSLNTLTGAISFPFAPGGRITLATGVPLTASDVTGATNVFYSAAGGQYAPVYDGSSWRGIDISTDLSLALDSSSGHTGYHQSGKNFDVWCAYVSGTTYFGTGPAWSTDVLRGTGAGTTELDIQNGIIVNKNTMTLRFGSASGNTVSVPAKQATLLGTIRCTADGQTEDSLVKRFVSQAYYATARPVKKVEPTASWPYSAAAWRQANGSAGNQVEFVNCLSGRVAQVFLRDVGVTSGATVNVLIGIGLDRTNGADSIPTDIAFDAAVRGGTAVYVGFPGLGYHSLKWLEFGAGSGTQTWFGQSAYGMTGSVEA